jgi:hypothetical protein
MTSSVAREACPPYVRDWPGHTRWRIAETCLQVLRGEAMDLDYLLTERDRALDHVTDVIHLGVSVEIGSVRRDSIGNQRRQIHQG